MSTATLANHTSGTFEDAMPSASSQAAAMAAAKAASKVKVKKLGRKSTALLAQQAAAVVAAGGNLRVVSRNKQQLLEIPIDIMHK